MFGEVLEVRTDAGLRLKTLQIRWFDGCVERMAPLAQFVDRLEFYHVTGEMSHGVELPKECMIGGRWWEPWSRKSREKRNVIHLVGRSFRRDRPGP